MATWAAPTGAAKVVRRVWNTGSSPRTGSPTGSVYKKDIEGSLAFHLWISYIQILQIRFISFYLIFLVHCMEVIPPSGDSMLGFFREGRSFLFLTRSSLASPPFECSSSSMVMSWHGPPDGHREGTCEATEKETEHCNCIRSHSWHRPYTNSH